MDLKTAIALVCLALIVGVMLARLFRRKPKEQTPARAVQPAPVPTAAPAPRPVLVAPVAPAPSVQELMRRLEMTSSLEQVRDILDLSDDDGLTRSGYDKIDILVRTRLTTVTTVEQALDLYGDVPDVEDPKLDLLEQAILDRTLMLATDYEACKEIIEWASDSWPSDDYQNLVFDRALELVSNFDEAYELYDMLEEDYEDNAYSRQVMDKAIGFITSIEDCETLDKKVVEADDEVDIMVAKRKLDFCTTVEECGEVWDMDDLDSEVSKAAICRAADLIRAET